MDTFTIKKFRTKFLLNLILIIGLMPSLWYIDYLFFVEKILILISLFVLSLFVPLYVSQFENKSLRDSIKRIYLSSYITFYLFIILTSFSNSGDDSVFDRHFSFKTMTLYYAVEDFHFYEEAQVKIKKMGFAGFGIQESLFFSNGCTGCILQETNGQVYLDYHRE